MSKSTPRTSRKKDAASNASRPGRGPNPSTRRFVEVLRQAQRDEGEKRKGERTRDRLKIAAIQVLEQRGYLNMRVSDICKRAGVSAAVFYLYFKNKRDITVEVLTEFLDSLFAYSGAGDASRSVFEAMCEANLMWLNSVRTNAGLMRCLLQLSDNEADFKELSEQKNYEWFQRVTYALTKRFPHSQVDERSLLLVVYALGGMMDELCRKLLVARDVQLQSLVNDTAPTDEALAELLSVMWYRALFARDPESIRHASSRALVRLSMNAEADRVARDG